MKLFQKERHIDDARVRKAWDALFWLCDYQEAYWPRRMELVLSRSIKEHAKDPARLAAVLSCYFRDAIWPNCLLAAIDDWVHGCPRREYEEPEISRRIENNYGRNQRRGSYAEWFRKQAVYKAFRKVSAAIPNHYREMAYAVSNDHENCQNVLLHLICFPEFDKLLESNPLLARTYAESVEGYTIWKDEKLRQTRAKTIKEGARAVLREMGLPGERRILKVFQKQENRKAYHWRPFNVISLAKNKNCSRVLDQIGRSTFPVHVDLFDYLAHSGLPLNFHLLNELHHAQISQETSHYLDRPYTKDPTSYVRDTRYLLLRAKHSDTYLSRIQTIDDLIRYHDRWSVRLNRQNTVQETDIKETNFEVTPPFKAPKGGTAICTDHQLRGAARRFKNCSAGYAQRISKGKYAIYTLKSDVMLGIKKDEERGFWYLDQALGPRNKAPSPSAKQKIQAWAAVNSILA